MNDSNEKNKTTKRQPLTLKNTNASIRQNVMQGKTRSIVVEKKKKRILMPDGKTPTKTVKPVQKKEEALRIAAQKLGLSEQEYKRRQRALENVNKQEEQRRQKLEEEEKLRQKQEAERIALQKALKEEQAQKEAEEQANNKPVSKTEKAKSKQETSIPTTSHDEKTARITPIEKDSNSTHSRKKEKEDTYHSTPRKKGFSDDMMDEYERSKKRSASQKSWNESRRKKSKLTLSSILNEDEERQRSLASVKRARLREKENRKETREERHIAREVIIPEFITIQELANRMAVQTTKVIKYLIQQGTMAKQNDVLDGDTAQLITEEFGHSVKRVSEADVEEGFIGQDDHAENTQPRTPIVTVMGHVDHGKTSLLDALRESDIASKEAGGITQHIGAYQVRLEEGTKPVTFIDTPGHAAFSAMRARGAKLTDIVILIVSADDGVMPQTIEAIHHAKEANVPIIVAINKMDKPGADPQKVLNGLLQHNVIVESLGGDVQSIEISAKKRTGLEALISAILLQAELLELSANFERAADGIVIESKIDKGRGPLSSVIVRRGRLNKGDIIVAGDEWGRVRALVDERGQQKQFVSVSEPIEILGLNGAPEPGELFAVVESEAKARQITEYRRRKQKENKLGANLPTTLENIMSRLKEQEIKELPVLIKADTQGSAEAIATALDKIGNEEVRVRIIYAATGGISESDVLLAKGSNAPIIGFNVRANPKARQLAEWEDLEIRYYSIIYDLIDDLKLALEGMLTPEKREDFLGNAEILEVFSVSKIGKIAGCRVTEGIVKRGAKVRLLRDDVIIHEGELSTLKHFKDDVEEVKSGQECGMSFERYQDLRKGDKIECFNITEIARKLSS